MGGHDDMNGRDLGDQGHIALEALEQEERLGRLTPGRLVFMIAVCVVVVIISFLMIVSSYLSLEATFKVKDRPVNVLLLGVDQTYDDKGEIIDGLGRADTIILMSMNPRQGKSYIVSIPRDTRVNIPGRGTAKVNAAYVYGGPELIAETVEGLIGMPVDRFVEVDFNGFVGMIDAIGGIEVDVDRNMRYVDKAGGLEVNIKKGRQVLDGEKALQYVRFRADVLGDITRVGRQQNLLGILIKELATYDNIRKAPELMKIITEYVKTDLSQRDMISAGWFLIKTQGDVLSQTLPGDFYMQYWVTKEDAVREMVDNIVQGYER
jgi:LCP family protein required for cell wall assembly